MKNFILPLLICIPFFCSAQYRVTLKKESAPKGQLNLNATGNYFRMASSNLLIGTGMELGGAAIAVIASGNDVQAGQIVGGAMAVTGLILQIAGYIDMGRAAKTFRFTGNGVSVTF